MNDSHLRFLLNEVGVAEAKADAWWNTTNHGDKMLWLASRQFGTPGETHGGKRRASLVLAVLQSTDVNISSQREYATAIGKIEQWLYEGSAAATIGSVRTACYKAFTKLGSGSKERALLYLVLFAGNYNAGYEYRTAYDDAYDKSIYVLQPSLETMAESLRTSYTWENIREA